MTLGMWPPPGPPSRLDRCCWIDSRTLARLGAPSLPPGSGVGAGAPAWTKPRGLPPPCLPPVTHSLPSCPHVGWGHLNLTALPLDPPQPPQDLLRPCMGTNLAAALGGGRALSRAPSLHREDLPRAVLGAGAARPPPGPPGCLGGVSFIFLNKTKWNLCLRAWSPAPGPCRAARLCAGGGAWEVSLGLAVVSLLLGDSAVTHQDGAGGGLFGARGLPAPPSYLFMGWGGGQGCFPPPSWPGAHRGVSSYRCVY